MTEMLFRADPYLREARATVTAHTDEGGIILDRTIFYPTGGGQPGDSGQVATSGRTIEIATTIKGQGGDIILIPAEAGPLPALGSEISQILNWDRRYRFMRIHTGLHLLSVAIPLGVTGGQISEEKGRLDFDMPEAPPDKQAIEDALNDLIQMNYPVWEGQITDAELDANPEMVKTMSVQPPRGAGVIRLIGIGEGDGQIDLQPCGGTHVANTSEIGRIRIGKVEKKGKRNRRVNMHLAT